MTPQEARVCTWLFEQSHHSLSVLSLSRDRPLATTKLATIHLDHAGVKISAISNSQFCSNGKNMSHQQMWRRSWCEGSKRDEDCGFSLSCCWFYLFGVWLWLLLIESKWLASSGFERNFLIYQKKNVFLFLVWKISSFPTTQTVHSSINTTSAKTNPETSQKARACF